jgi:hypothetical protein
VLYGFTILSKLNHRWLEDVAAPHRKALLCKSINLPYDTVEDLLVAPLMLLFLKTYD